LITRIVFLERRDDQIVAVDVGVLGTVRIILQFLVAEAAAAVLMTPFGGVDRAFIVEFVAPDRNPAVDDFNRSAFVRVSMSAVFVVVICVVASSVVGSVVVPVSAEVSVETSVVVSASVDDVVAVLVGMPVSPQPTAVARTSVIADKMRSFLNM
jgi:hypothetical protein